MSHRFVLATLLAALSLAAAPAPTAPPASTAIAPATTTSRPSPMAGKLDQPADKPATRTGGWMGLHNNLVTLAKAGNIDLYFEGDSITDYWNRTNRPDTTHPYHESFQKYFGGWKTANFGIAADRTENVLWRITNGELDGPALKPKVIVLLIGTNNLPKDMQNYLPKTPADDAAGVKAILDVMQQKQPQAKILLLSVFPREDKINSTTPEYREDLNPKIKELNALLAKFDDGKQIKFLDIYDKFLGPDGHLLPGTFADKLHPTAKGYDIWAQAMLPILTEWLGPPATATAPTTAPAK